MSRNFNGTTDKAQVSITDPGDTDFTICAWINPDNAGENNFGRIFWVETSGAAMYIEFTMVNGAGTNNHLQIKADHATTDARARSDNMVADDEDAFIVATYDASTNTCELYKGNQSTEITAARSLSIDDTGAGARTTGGVTLVIGNKADQSRTFDGDIGEVSFWNRVLTIPEMNAIKNGLRPVDDGNLIGYWPLDSPTASAGEDLSRNNYNLTVTGTTVTTSWPVAWSYGDMAIMVEVSPAGTVYDETGLSFQHTYTTSTTDAAVRDETGTTPNSLILSLGGSDAVTADETANPAAALAFTLSGTDAATMPETGQVASVSFTITGTDSIPIDETGLSFQATFTVGGSDDYTMGETGLQAPVTFTVGESDTSSMVGTGGSLQVIFVVGGSDVLNPGGPVAIRPTVRSEDRMLESAVKAEEGQQGRKRVFTG